MVNIEPADSYGLCSERGVFDRDKGVPDLSVEVDTMAQ